MDHTAGPETVPARAGQQVPRILTTGTLLDGRYRVEEVLGRGGMAVVYRACDERDGRPVAIKLFHTDPDTAEDAERQAAEVAILRDLDHPHIVRALGAGTDADGVGRSYLVLELVHGQTLAQRIADRPLAGTEIAQLGRQIAAALADIHARGIVHRDIKPANILLSPPAEAGVCAKLTDFGVARVLDGTSLTMYGMTVGTANYLSPEQALGHEITARSDIYCLGLTLLEAFTARKAFPGHGVDAALARLVRDPEVPASLGPAWSTLLRAMTAPDPLDRPSATDVEWQLAELAGDVPALHALHAAEPHPDHHLDDEEIFGPLADFNWQAEEDGVEGPRASVPRSRWRGAFRRRLAPAA
ncbi:MAG TPA: serine/threonine-protein kinase [Jatrophihabitans sp.]|nr:serine/threonine-protein kinase [Jatrophihabitans sp.]